MGSGALSAGPPAPPTPHKKMKKRKELNALIGLSGDGGRKKPKKGTGHRLLRTEPPGTDSETDTEEEEYSQIESGPGLGRGTFLQCCRVCYPLCGFVVMTACVVTCIGLVWMQVSMKENMDALKETFRAMESSQKSSLQEIPKISEDLLAKQKQLDELEAGDMGLNKLWTNITEINKQIAQLTVAVNLLKANIKSASDLISLPNTVEELQKSVATLGSTLTSVHHDVETLQTEAEEQKKKLETLQGDMAKITTKDNGQMSTTPPAISSRSHSQTQDILYLQNSVDDLNITMLQYQRQNDLKLHSIDTSIANISQRVALIENDLQLSNKTEKKENISAGLMDNMTSLDTSGNSIRADPTETPDKAESPASKFREQLQLIHALTNQPENDQKHTEEKSGSDTVTPRPSLARISPRSLEAGKPGLITDRSLPGISTERALEELFRNSEYGIDGKLSYQELEQLLGPGLTEPQYFKEFDADGDGRYSFTELRAVVSAQ
ncbi:EF-hand calcium-binding domain-containing protein 14 isoform 2-T2 [Discoglossus pictus]